MIEQNTVFIVGAGGSFPYGFPTGKELRWQICKSFTAEFDEIYGYDFDADNAKRQEIIKLAESFTKVFYNSSTPSIDLFLSRNPKFSSIGKKAIAWHILLSEAASVFHEDTEFSQDWYTHLYQRMSEGLTTPDSFTDFSKNKVTFITFNYDRSLEHYLYDSFINSFTSLDLKEHKTKSIFPFEFHHVYGKIDELPWQGGNYEYRTPVDLKTINATYENIRVIHERTKGDLSKVIETLAYADRIFFLGFGYAKENLEILGIPTIFDGRQKIYGTALRMTEREIRTVRSSLNLNFENKDPALSNPRIKDMNCYELLRRYL